MTGRRPRGAHRSRLLLAWALLLAAPLALGACGDSLPDHVREDARRRRLEELGVEADPTGTAPRAGMSAIREVDVEPLDRRRLGSDTLSAEFHLFLHRCGACHAPPDPAMHTAAEWRSTLTRMHRNIEDAGLLPIAGEDRERILAFLARHAAERRR